MAFCPTFPLIVKHDTTKGGGGGGGDEFDDKYWKFKIAAEILLAKFENTCININFTSASKSPSHLTFELPKRVFEGSFPCKMIFSADTNFPVFKCR